MKLVEHFRSFLNDTVNLNQTRLEQLETSVEALKDVIRESYWEALVNTFTEQGSWALRTIIKPVDGKPFDADLVVIVDPVEGWEAKDYLSTLRALFADHGTYEDKVHRCSHCITIEYAGERRVDLVPCIRDRNGVPGHEVCNFNSNAFERSEPEAYTDWLKQRNDWTGGNGLKKVTRLLKYLRDIKGTFSCPSILLTTLLGMQIQNYDEHLAELFEDVPTALQTIVQRLDDWLQARPEKPAIRNPVLATELFSDRWDDDKYKNFRDKFHQYRTWIDEAFEEQDRDESIGKWRRVFGDEFASAAVIEKAARVTQDAKALVLAERADLAFDPNDDLVRLLSRFGLARLRPEMNRLFQGLPHKQRPTWRPSPHGRFPLIVTASLHETKEGPKLADVASGTPLRKGLWLRFSVRQAAGAKFDDDYRVHWRITNTDREAFAARCMRGKFEKANDARDGTSHWESLAYRGVHTAEAFVVRKRDKMLVGQSEPFYVVIE
jgi:hypothetical protein